MTATTRSTCARPTMGAGLARGRAGGRAGGGAVLKCELKLDHGATSCWLCCSLLSGATPPPPALCSLMGLFFFSFVLDFAVIGVGLRGKCGGRACRHSHPLSLSSKSQDGQGGAGTTRCALASSPCARSTPLAPCPKHGSRSRGGPPRNSPPHPPPPLAPRRRRPAGAREAAGHAAAALHKGGALVLPPGVHG